MPAPTVFITGAAAGIGLAAARRFHAAGWRVGLADVDAEGLARAVQQLGEGASAHPLDVRDPAVWDAALQSFLGASEPLNCLINNAGVLCAGDFGEIPLARHQRLIEINIGGVVNGCHRALPWLRRAPDARVLNLCSASAIHGQPSIASYSASKFFVRGFTEALDIEWRPLGVRVSALWPIFVQTAMVSDNPQMRAAEKLGVHLGPADVAAVLLRTATARRPPLHVPVGFQSAAMRQLVRLLPDRLTQRLVAYFAGV